MSTSHTRLYGAAIAIVSGSYSVGSAVVDAMDMMPTSDSVMLVIGVVVFVHGIVLLTPLAPHLGRFSGPLMVLWALVMIGNQVVAAAMSNGAMTPMTWDGGMLALAVLMLVSGLIMGRTERM